MSRCAPKKNADLLIKIGLMVTEPGTPVAISSITYAAVVLDFQ